MAKPIYAGSYSNRGRGRWKRVFIIVVLLHIAGVVLYVMRDKTDDTAPADNASIQAPAPDALVLPDAPLTPTAPDLAVAVATPESKAAVSDAQAAIAGGQLIDAKRILDQTVSTTPDPAAIRLLGEVNIKLLTSQVMTPEKQRYTIQSGDSLSKIAGTFDTTVELIKKINGLENNLIRSGASLTVFTGDFSVRVSKTHNHLDLMMNGQLFKRYPVGTGKFGKTPAVEFYVYDKIRNPAWTRPSDGRIVKFGEKENVLGTRWMALKADDHPELTGFGIHGTWEPESIGHQSSAGCVRMLNEDVEELFDLLPRKTPVMITD